jgi:hypothetical protein
VYYATTDESIAFEYFPVAGESQIARGDYLVNQWGAIFLALPFLLVG